ncbi:MAG: DUF2070 family protein [Euryarchaeota archaeon]|nr:DUF2070 family protein [Euryarchaeota archaeon]
MSFDSSVSRLQGYLFRAPPARITVGISILVSLLAIPLLGGLREALLMSVIPAVAAALLTHPMVRILGGTFTLRRSALLSLVGAFGLLLFLLAHRAGAPWLHLPTLGGFYLGLGFLWGFRTVLLVAIARLHPLMALPAGLHTLPALLGAALLGPVPWTPVLLVMLLFLAASLFYLWVVDAPMRRLLGTPGYPFFRGYLSQKDEPQRLESFFASIGEPADLPVSAFDFQTPQGKRKAAFVVSMAHPGPVGHVGGGNLSERFAGALDGPVFPFHGATHYDMSPATTPGAQQVVEAARRALDRVKPAPGATPSITVSRGWFQVHAQRFGDSILLVASPLQPADDLDFSLGLLAAASAGRDGIRTVTLADAHNLGTEDAPVVAPGTRPASDLMGAIGEALRLLEREPLHPLRMGVASMQVQGSTLGALGLQAAVAEAGGQRTAYLLFDGNNMAPGLREKLAEGLPVDRVVVATTDTHTVNLLQVRNYVGSSGDEEALREAARRMVQAALADLEEVRAGAHTEVAEGVRTLGPQRSAMLVSTAHAVSILGTTLGVVLTLLASGVGLWVLARMGN